MKYPCKFAAIALAAIAGWKAGAALDAVGATAGTAEKAPNKEWNQWGGAPDRNNVPVGKDIVTEWNVGKFDYKTGAWNSEKAKNIKWVARLGSQTYGNPVVADGKVFVGTNNSGGWIERYPSDVDLGCLIAFDEKDGNFLWQHSSEKLPTGRVHDWPLQGICSAPYVLGDRLYYVTSRGEVACLDTNGFHDGENDGEVTNEEEIAKRGAAARKNQLVAQMEQLGAQLDESNREQLLSLKAQLESDLYDLKKEADVVWVYDMMKEMDVSQHNMASCSITGVGDLLFVCTSNGVDYEHNYIPVPDAPSFFVMDRNTRKILWTDASPGLNILHGQWSSPAYGVFAGQPQVIFGGGDGWVYSFDPEGDGEGNAKLLWKFDANPKQSHYSLNRATRNHIIATPVVYDGLVYVAVGEDPEHGEGVGHLWCIDPTKRGDVSAELAFNKEDPEKPIAHKRLQAVVPEEGDFTRPNPNTAVVWHYSEVDRDENGKVAFEETMHRTVGTVAIKDDVLYIADFSGLFHCLDAKTGKPHWSYDMMSAAWGSPLIVEDKVYIGDEDGEVAIFRHSADPEVAMEDGEPYYGTCDMGNSVYSTPIVADNVLYVCNRTHLFAITPEGK